MLAFQRYCKIHKTKMLFFTSFIGLMSALCLVFIPLMVIKKGPMVLLDDPFARQVAFGFPITFIILLFIQKIFTLYIEGNFFSQQALKTIQHLARICLLFGLVIEPGILLLVSSMSSENADYIEVYISNYLFLANFPVAILGYALHLVSGVNKIARDIDEEQKLTV